MRLALVTALLLASALPLAAQAACPRWMFTKQTPARAVAIVAHGMNLLPERMTEVAEILTNAGVDVLLAGLSGHCGEPDGFTWVTEDELRTDALSIYEVAAARAERLRVPLHLVAYSISAAIFDAHRDQMPFARRVFLAPSFTQKFWYRAVRLLTYLPDWFPLPSTMLPEYRAAHVGRVPGTRALMDVIATWKKQDQALPRPSGGEPTLILIHPNDELVAAGPLAQLITDRRYTNWKFEPLSIAGATSPRPQYHRIIDRASVGDAEWERMRGVVLNFLSLTPAPQR